ncbi:helix-turn-helix transcriptional regulator [Sphaerimonospora mesophila]|uniref:helix-turn-helix transcriptional regulator n=1 Tax=Sphaerimonospora mesophila TaxID=37483 RepID=UPI0009F9ABF9
MTPEDPVRVVARRVRELRRRKGWTAAQLGEALTAQGVPWDRFTVSNLENGKRQNVTLTELLALATVLDVALVHLFVPLNDNPVKVTPNRTEDADTVRAWVRGQEPLPGMDERIFMTEVAIADLISARRASRGE